jgi:hypothetical protein
VPQQSTVAKMAIGNKREKLLLREGELVNYP